MTRQAEQQAMNEIFQDVPVIRPSDLELFEMFETFLKTQDPEKGTEEIPNLPRGYGQ